MDPELDPASGADFIQANRRQAIGTAVTALDADPVAASRSVELSQATGVPAPIINGDLENFEQQHKASLTAQLLNSNDYLQKFINSDPMVAKVFNQQYANLDAVSQRISGMGFLQRTRQALDLSHLAFPGTDDPLARFKGGGPIGDTGASLDDLRNHPFQSAAWATIATPLDLLFRGLTGVFETGADEVKNIATSIGGESFGREAGALVETEAMGLSGHHAIHLPEDPAARPHQLDEGTNVSPKIPDKQADSIRRALYYAENRREPLPTMLPEYDKYRADQNKDDVDELKEATAESQEPREPSPSMFRSFIAQHTDAEIGVGGDAVAALYGDKVPNPDDGLLGWVPGIEDKLAIARATGADVSIPLADWLTHAEPETMQALHDDLRVRPGGITANEVKASSEAKEGLPEGVKPPGEAPINEDVPSLRAATALEPLFSVGDRKLSLERLQPEGMGAEQALSLPMGKSGFPDFHDFDIKDQNGQSVGTLNLSTQKQGKQLYVEMINGIGGLGPRDFGPALMRDLLRQLKAEFPEAESITGHRVSGAREKAGSYMAASASPVVKLDNPDIGDLTHVLNSGQWEEYSHKVQAYIKPYAERNAADRQIIDAVNEELARIAPQKLQTQAADWITAKGVEGQGQELIHPTGAYINYKEAYPILLYALDGENTLGTARHEAIHHLRGYGFFNDAEWGTLEKAVSDNRWIDQYNIEKRYPSLSPALRREEAIADAYKAWAAGAEVPPEVHGIFERMKQFFDAIREHIAKLLGKPPTWEDIFQKVSTGEIGGREGTQPLDARAFNEKLAIGDKGGNVSGDLERRLREAGMDRSNASYFANEGNDYKTGLWTTIPLDELTGLDKTKVAALKREFKTEVRGNELWVRIREYGKDGSLGIEKYPDEKLSVEEQPEGGSRVFERASALGMTVDQFKAYDKLIAARHAEDIAAAEKRAADFQRKTQTKEWKDNRRELRTDISREIHQRPDVAADLFFSTGELYGQKIATGYKIDSDQLTPEQKAAIPKDYQARGGLNPDDVANIFGYGSGDAMLQRLAEYNAAKKASGLGAKDFVARVTDAEADRQMRLRHGVLEDNIVDSVKEQVASETQLDILHEETHKLGMEIGQAPLDKGAILTGLRDSFNKMQIGSLSSDAYMRAAGKSGRAAELALLKNAPQEAFRAKQQQYYATVIANLAIKTEKTLGQFDKVAKRFSQRTIATVDQEYTNFIHDILMRVGKPVRRSIQDLETEIAAGEYKSLPEFVQGKETHGLREVPVADILLDPSFRKKFEDLTVDEFNATNDSIKTLVKNGRDEKKINKAGEAFDLNEVKQQMIDQLAATSLEPKKYDAKGKRTDTYLPKFIRSFSMNIMQLETLFNRFDEGNAQGPFQQFIMRDLADASSNEGVLRKKYAAMVKALDDKADLKKAVDNTIFKVPDSDQLMKFNRENLRAVLLNMGNESNMSKLARGYNIEPTALWDWVGKHATKEDWDWAQKMGDVFAEIKKEADTMYRNLSGVAPASLDIKPVQTLHGEYPGWYYPIINHPEFEGKSKKLMGPNALEGEGFVRATTPSGYTKGRTGYAGPMALDLDALPSRMTQMLHDIAMRPAVINASKMFYDKDFRSAISKYYNTEAKDMLIPYLQSVANSANYIPKNQKDLANLSEFVRQNMINTLVGLNPGTVLKHGPTAAIQSLQEVGTVNFLKAVKGLFSVNEATGENNWQFAMKTFDELQLRHRNYEETLGGAMNEIAPQGQFMSLRRTIQKYASTPVALSDLLSAVPTALAQYSKSMEEGLSHGDAVFMANRAVRRAHGSMAITNRSAVQRVGPLAQWLVSVYGFFNHIANRQYELAWKSGDALGLTKQGDYSEAMSRVPEITSKLFAYVIAPAIIEQIVTPLEGSDKDSFAWKAAKGIAFTLGASWPVVRDIVSGLTGGRDPSVGLLTTAGKAITDVGRDLAKDHPLSKEHAGKVIRDGSVLLGIGTGMVTGQVGKTAQFAQGVHAGTERPKGPWGWMVGSRFGTLKNHAGTFQEWQRHH